MKKCLLVLLLLVFVMPMGTMNAKADDYPSRPINMLMPFGVGNAPDAMARIIGEYLQKKHNVTLILVSKTGANGVPAMLEIKKSRPDGYTISLTSANVLTVAPQYKNSGFTYKDFAHVLQTNLFTMAWGVRKDSGITDVKMLMEKAKAEKGKYTVASPGALSGQKFYHDSLMENFPDSDLPYVSYPGGAQVVTALLGGHVTAGFTPAPNLLPQKDLKIIAVSSAKRDPAIPDAPTFSEILGKEFVYDSVYGIVAPIKTPKKILAKLESLFQEALADPDVKAKLAKINVTPKFLPGAEFTKVLDSYHKFFEEPIRVAREKAESGSK